MHNMKVMYSNTVSRRYLLFPYYHRMVINFDHSKLTLCLMLMVTFRLKICKYCELFFKEQTLNVVY